MGLGDNDSVNIAEFINRNGDTLVSHDTGGGEFKPENHPDYIRAKRDGTFTGILMCRNCGNDTESDGFGRTVRQTIVGHDDGYAFSNSAGDVEYDQSSYVEDADVQDSETVDYYCLNCGREEEELEDLVIAVPETPLEDEASIEWELNSFYRSVVEKRLIVFDASEWEEEKAERDREQAISARAALEAQKARIEAQLANIKSDEIPF